MPPVRVVSDNLAAAITGIIDDAERGAIQGLQATARYTLARAKYYVPVRELFGRARPRTQFPRGEGIEIRTAKQYEQFKRSAPKVKSIEAPTSAFGPHLQESTTAQSQRFKSSFPNSRANPGTGNRIFGHAGSEFPVLRTKGVTVAGPFRNYNSRRGRLANVPFIGQMRSGFASANPALSSRGRYEVKTARAKFLNPNGQAQIGGTLKDALRILNDTPIRDGGVLWMYVGVDPDARYADGKSAAQVGRYQEFGTRHNRAHPFLRPALYESTSPLVENTRRAIRAAVRGMG